MVSILASSVVDGGLGSNQTSSVVDGGLGSNQTIKLAFAAYLLNNRH